MKNIISKIVFAIIVLAVGVWGVSSIISSCRSATQKEKAETEKKVQIEQNISGMVARHNAVIGWEEIFNVEDIVTGQVYTLQVEDALVRKDGRPILLFGSVSDIVRRNNEYFVHFKKGVLDFSIPDIYFALKLNAEQIKKIIGQKTEIFDRYAIVATITSVQRPKFDVKAYSQNGEDGKSEYTEIAVEPCNIFIAKGRCLDLLFVGEYEPKEKIVQK